jgi:hypothetical protein
MRNRDLKKADWWRWGHGSGTATVTSPSGYLKRCRYCGERIYVKRDYDGEWRPYESYIDGKVEEGEWTLHDCTG